MKRLILTSCLCVLFASCTALADWNVDDPYKMHFPQLPDPDGWDVEFHQTVPQLADDWECSETGYVDDVHIWYSWEDDSVGIINKVQLGIWSNSPDPDGEGELFSKPDELVWGFLDVFPDDFTTRDWTTGGKQGWYEPSNDYYEIEDHYKIYQLNIVDIVGIVAELVDIEPFRQEEGEIYWLSVCLWMGEDPNSPGWKTSEDHFMDDAVWWNGNNSGWNELRDPTNGESLDLAFVITPEPATLALLGLGSMVLLRKRRA